VRGEFPATARPGETLVALVEIENTGNTLWLVSRAAPRGTVRVGLKILNEKNEVIDEAHGSPPLPRAMAPGEKVTLKIKRPAPKAIGHYMLKVDLVDQDICWFEQKGSEPIMLAFEVLAG